MSNTTYRADIDCLRSFAVFIVILFHCGFTFIQGGFIGVDIFFVISGYVMYKSVRQKEILRPVSFIEFYKKRLFRIYPVLLLTLSISTAFALLWMGTDALDSYGKQLFFSSASLSNVLFAEGQNYFDTKTPILLHTWSLAVEMQFYALFPFYMLAYGLIKRRSNALGFAFIATTTALSFGYAQIHVGDKGAFYGIENRGFEFLIGVLAAALPVSRKNKNPFSLLPILMIAGLIFVAITFQPAQPQHPGFYTLIPTLLSAALILIFANYDFYKHKALDALSYIGRISYGIYLFHFPVTVFAKDIFSFSAWEILCANIFITLPLAHLSYRYFETPIRQYGYKTARPYIGCATILICALTLSAFGYITAKKQGWPQRLKYFNEYAYQVNQIHAQSKESFTRGINIKSGEKAQILFIGDSVLQQYIDPILSALNISKDNSDSITRGGCVLLKGVDFKDTFADISCDTLRRALYENKKQYDLIIFSQSWDRYQDTILNAQKSTDYNYLAPFIEDTIKSLAPYTKDIIILGRHPMITFNAPLQIDLFLTKDRYSDFKNSLQITNESDLVNTAILNDIARRNNITIIHPMDIFCPYKKCETSNDNWSYFFDEEHLTKTGQDKAKEYITHYFNHLKEQR